MNIICSLSKDNNITVTYEQEDKDISIVPRWTYLGNKNDLYSYGTETVLDLLFISICVFSADKIIKRNSYHNGWSREMCLHIPVYELALWEKNKDLLQKTLNFLSGDYWSFVFTKRSTHLIRKPLIDIRDKRDSVSLLSGGLDSFIGAINLLENKEKPVFLSWRGGGKTTGKTQKSIKQLLINYYKIDKSNFKDFYLSVKGEEKTTRTRSFFLFSHAVSLCYEKKTNHKIIVPENGFISLNIPLTEARAGSSSTKTTHPYYLGLLNSLLKGLDLDVEITNPYQFLSKGQMIEKCKNIEFLKEYLKLTVSCSHPDTRGKAVQGQCGYCWPCIVRRGAILSSIGYDDTEYTFWNKSSSNNYFKTYQLFLSKIEHSSDSIIFASGQLNYEDYDKYKKVLYNGCRELEKALIDDEIKKNSLGGIEK